MTCPACGLRSEWSLRARLLGASQKYVADLRCPRCGFMSGAAWLRVVQGFLIWGLMFAEDEGVPPEQRLDVWKQKWLRREALTGLLQDDARYWVERPQEL